MLGGGIVRTVPYLFFESIDVCMFTPLSIPSSIFRIMTREVFVEHRKRSDACTIDRASPVLNRVLFWTISLACLIVGHPVFYRACSIRYVRRYPSILSIASQLVRHSISHILSCAIIQLRDRRFCTIPYEDNPDLTSICISSYAYAFVVAVRRQYGDSILAHRGLMLVW
jgi:hypothetical protein